MAHFVDEVLTGVLRFTYPGGPVSPFKLGGALADQNGSSSSIPLCRRKCPHQYPSWNSCSSGNWHVSKNGVDCAFANYSVALDLQISVRHILVVSLPMLIQNVFKSVLNIFRRF